MNESVAALVPLSQPMEPLRGTIIMAKTSYALCIPPQLLHIDCRSWLAELEAHHRLEAVAARETHSEYAVEMNEAADHLADLIRAGRWVDLPGMWRPVVERARFPMWGVGNREEAFAYARHLLEWGTSGASSGDAYWSLQLDWEDGPRLQLAFNMGAYRAHSGSCVTTQWAPKFHLTLLADRAAQRGLK